MKAHKKTKKPKSLQKPQLPVNKSKSAPGYWSFFSGKGHLIGLLIICLLVIIIRLNFLDIPFERDEGAYSYYGRLILDGKTPYISFYETKPPGLFYIYALLQLLFGSTVQSLHVAVIAVNLLTIIFIFLITGSLMDKPSGLIAAASFALLSVGKNISGFTVQGEHMVLLFAVAGFWLLLKALENDKWYSFLAAGIFISMSFMIKQNGLLFLLFAGVVILARYLVQKPVAIKKLFFNGSIFTAGVLLVIAIFVFVIFIQDAIAEFWKWVYIVPRSYTSQVSLERGIDNFQWNLGRQFDDNPVLMLMAGAGFILSFFNPLKLFKKVFILMLPVFSFLSIIPGFWFYNHYFILLTPAMAVCTGSAFYSVKIYLTKKLNTGVSSGILASVFVLVFQQNLHAGRVYYFNPDYTMILKEVYGTNPFPEAWEVSKVVKERTKEGDIVGVLGGEPEVFIYTGRRGPSAHDMAILLYGGSGIRSKEWQHLYIADVEKAKPKYFVCFSNPISLMSYITDTSFFRWFDNYMANYYQLEGVADMISPYETKYVWDKDVNTYKLQRTHGVVFVFRRRDSS